MIPKGGGPSMVGKNQHGFTMRWMLGREHQDKIIVVSAVDVVIIGDVVRHLIDQWLCSHVCYFFELNYLSNPLSFIVVVK